MGTVADYVYWNDRQIKLRNRLDYKSSRCSFYREKINGVSMVIKKAFTDQDSLLTEKRNTELIREAKIAFSLNKLKLPTFVRALGLYEAAIDLDQELVQSSAIFYEYLNGTTLDKMLSQNKLNFKQFLSIMVQILLSLEVAQRTENFTHFDLHCANVMIVKGKKYSIVLDDNEYVINPQFCPVIIDFGTSTCSINEKVVGSTYYIDCNILKYCVQGADMYKLLFHCYMHSVGELQRQIGELFLFYGGYDPYKVLISTETQLYQYSTEFLKKAVDSAVATYIPLELAHYILKKYVNEVSGIQIVDRSEITVTTITSITSFPITVAMSYISYIALKYAGKHGNADCQIFLLSIGKEERLTLIRHDFETLEQYISIPLPSEIALRDVCNEILSIPLNSVRLSGSSADSIGVFIDESAEPNEQIDPIESNEIDTLAEEFIRQTEFFRLFQPYLDYLYIIRELKLTRVYNNFVATFTASKQYALWRNTVVIRERTRRWLFSLSEALQCRDFND